MGTLRDDLSRLEYRSRLCSVGKVLAGLDDDLRTELAEILADETVTLQPLSRLFYARGWRIHRDTIQKHREGKCICVVTR